MAENDRIYFAAGISAFVLRGASWVSRSWRAVVCGVLVAENDRT